MGDEAELVCCSSPLCLNSQSEHANSRSSAAAWLPSVIAMRHEIHCRLRPRQWTMTSPMRPFCLEHLRSYCYRVQTCILHSIAYTATCCMVHAACYTVIKLYAA